ncbi:30S ribosome-binding factor RbfA [Blochmannia endosymbiont of Camponotus sp.]|uniref:30S ribosome-binding factor RbfA n=1 Tax=Blochmannia endosymbiont of Camponotus sp. TaxID=700220 RepID=UPI00202465F2|nr:30S ribosome-binding factor RbfA [Blochmannia endosymbiont of Camponotus sp.]URJ24028.1 30S ribosome-binding factor RbfA [Blochmannia endosymbiont of Camponotus sp.]URJ25778.1 30S ribosome-binding factor RbfA [Blochmannia endosymbiont of Camponotus sp.]
MGDKEINFQQSYRVQRIAQEIHKKISIILQHRIDDIRIGMPTISGVQVSNDLKNANIFVTFIDKEGPEEIDTAVMILQRASRFIRFLLANTMRLRVAPILLFKYDSSLIEGSKVYSLISVTKRL